MRHALATATGAALLLAGQPAAAAGELLFGDLHVHSSYSADAYFTGNATADPDTAFRFAKGLPVVHPYHRARVRIGRPLDFLAVVDHAEFLGVVAKLVEGSEVVAETKLGEQLGELMKKGRTRQIFSLLLNELDGLTADSELNSERVRTSLWGESIDAAERHYEPGRFTTLIGWEWTPMPGGAHLHRVVILREGGEVARSFLPFSALDSEAPEELWRWLDATAGATGAHFVAIPHNPNLSFGRMFPLEDTRGDPIDADYARVRARWEPVVEVTQIKGDSETHPLLSPNDEFADFETYTPPLPPAADEALLEADAGSYARGALLRGLELAGRTGVNPYLFGLIGSTDAHTGLSSAEEDAFLGKFGSDSTPERKHRRLLPGAVGFDMAAAGLAAVWAEENTREAIFDALRRREVYATSGPRMRVHVFGGWDYAAEDAKAADLAGVGYAKGVPMGGRLGRARDGRAPTLLIRALKDPAGANLDRIQVVKGWLGADGTAREQVHDVALSDGRRLRDGRAPPVGDTVDRERGSYRNDIGDPELSAVWSDPDFDPSAGAFYYVRVLEIPTPRHSLYDALALGLDPKDTGRPAAIQERAYTSPIWYEP